jgi:hypothetical protein
MTVILIHTILRLRRLNVDLLFQRNAPTAELTSSDPLSFKGWEGERRLVVVMNLL